ncbi:MAG: hypothetical protein ACJAT7_001233 [Psychromonas sp.]|jgi:hypothetical protein|uniref:hypothetical protein n=1 Tax=Psychromonas sp. TaxID=1884585 RepID=UPI0039E280BC
MEMKLLIAALSFMSCSVIADVKTLVHDVNGKSEVTVQNVGDTACTLNYKNSDYLTSEGMPIFYTFQVELHEGELQEGMQSWLPHGIKPGEPSILSFHDTTIGKIYEYTDNTSLYGELFYKTNLLTHFLAVDKILMRQGGVTINMPVYKKAEISNKTINVFKNCIKKLDKALLTFCKSSNDASKLCIAKKANANKGSVNELIKNDPEFIAAAKIKALKEARALDATKALEANKAFEAAVAIEVAKALREARVKAFKAAVDKAAAAKNRKKLTIFADNVEAPFHLNKFGHNDPAIAKIIKGGMRGNVMRVNYPADGGVAYYASNSGIDYSEYIYIEFDLKLISDHRADSKLNIKMDCFDSCSSGPYVIEKPRLGVWKHYQVRLEDLINNPGSNLDIANVNVPFAIFPDFGNQRGVAFIIDSVVMTNY